MLRPTGRTNAMPNTTSSATHSAPAATFVRQLGLFDSTMIVSGSMIGSGIFIVSADMARQLGSPGWLIMTWVITGLLTVAGALSYGELAAMMPRPGGQYVFLREAYSPMIGFLYGWTVFLVIQTGTIAAVAVAFSRYLGVLWPAISPTSWIIKPINLSSNYAISLSVQQVVGVLLVLFLTYLNTRGLKLGKLIQNTFTTVKGASLLGLIIICIVMGKHLSGAFSGFWTVRDAAAIQPDLSFISPVRASDGVFGLFVALCVAQVGSLFSADAWNNLAFAAAEVKNPKRTVPIATVLGVSLVLTLYVLANFGYLSTLTIKEIQTAPEDRVATAALDTIVGPTGAIIMAIAIMISTFGCNNGLILAGARVYYAMACDGLFFRSVSRLNRFNVPAAGLILQGLWASLLVLPRTRLRDSAGAPLIDPKSGMELYGNVYSNLLDYVVFSVVIFYVLCIAAVFIMRWKRPDAPRPYRTLGYPLVPLLYIIPASTIVIVLLIYKTQTTWPGLLIVLTGIPVYAIWSRLSSGHARPQVPLEEGAE